MQRRQRRLRSWWRHEQQSITAALATALHHSAQRPVPKKQEWEDAEYVALRGQKIDTRAHGGLRPALLAEPPHVVDRVQRHILEQTVVSAPGLQILDVPVPQMEDQLVDVFKVIEVPKIFLHDTFPQRSVLRRPQLAEQLVEVPSVSPSSCVIQQHSVEQTDDIPVHGGVWRARGGGSLLVFSLGQSSTAFSEAAEKVGSASQKTVAENSVAKVAEHSDAVSVAAKAGTFKTASQMTEGSATISGTAVSGNLQGSLPGQSSTSRRGHDLPIPSWWRRAEDASGRVYCWHVHTHQTRWTPPVTDDEDEEDEDEEDEEDEEVEDEDMDEIYAEFRFPAGFLPMRMCWWFPSGMGVFVRSLGERTAPPNSWSRVLTSFYGPWCLAVTCSVLVLPEVYRIMDFLGDDFWNQLQYSVPMLGLTADTLLRQSSGLSSYSALCLVQLWIHSLRQSTELFDEAHTFST